MKKRFFTLLLALFITGGSGLFATPLSVGTVVQDITLTDIKGNTFSLYQYLDQGYTVLIDISATWCGPCWSFEQTHTAQMLYEHYGPAGTTDPEKMIVIFIEGDVNTTLADLQGTGTQTQGDWVTGNDYPIVDATSGAEIGHFLTPGSTMISFPTFLLICPNKEVIWSQEGFSPSFNESFFVGKMGECPTDENPPSGIDDVVGFSSLTVYPNPAVEVLNLKLTSVPTPMTARVTVTNLLGQEVLQQQVSFSEGTQVQQVNVADLAAGIYLLNIVSPDGETIQRKFIKQ